MVGPGLAGGAVSASPPSVRNAVTPSMRIRTAAAARRDHGPAAIPLPPAVDAVEDGHHRPSRKTARNIARVAAARRMLDVVYFVLGDGHAPDGRRA